MEKQQDQEVHETPTKVELTPEEFEDLKKRAEVSSQNFERLRKKEEELEQLKVQLQENNLPDTIYSDEAKKLKEEIRVLTEKLNSTTSSLEKDKIFTQFPVLQDHEEAFKTFSEDPINAAMPLATRAKAFLIENDLLKTEPKRKGLEKPSATKVTKAPASGKMTVEDVKRLRETNPRKYQAMIEAGTLEIADD